MNGPKIASRLPDSSARNLSSPYCDTRLWGVEKWYLVPPKDAAMRFPDEVRKCVAFIGREIVDENGIIRQKFSATDFFVAVESESNASITHVYLVTGTHVVSALRDTEYFIRLNTQSGKSIRINGPPYNTWLFHPTDPDHVDVSVCELTPPAGTDTKWLPISMLHPGRPIHANPQIDSEDVGVGDETAITGLFTGHHGTERNIPIVRMGNIAMMLEEKVQTDHFGEIDAYLVEARSIGGLSGSPVFVVRLYPVIDVD
jgi:hypothetical protein